MGRHVAIVAGAVGYNNLRPLPCAENDCLEMALVLKQAGYEVEMVLGPQMTYDRVIKQARQMARDLERGGMLGLFFAVHGTDVGGRHALLCPEANLAGLKYFRHAIPVDELREETDRDDISRWMILDACWTELTSVRDSGDAPLRNAAEFRDIVAGYTPTVGTISIACSCSEGQQAVEGVKGRHGLFTAALLEELHEQMDAGAEVSLTDTVMQSIHQRMKALAKREGLPSTQIPCIRNNPSAPVMIPGKPRMVPPQRRG